MPRHASQNVWPHVVVRSAEFSSNERGLKHIEHSTVSAVDAGAATACSMSAGAGAGTAGTTGVISTTPSPEAGATGVPRMLNSSVVAGMAPPRDGGTVGRGCLEPTTASSKGAFRRASFQELSSSYHTPLGKCGGIMSGHQASRSLKVLNVTSRVGRTVQRTNSITACIYILHRGVSRRRKLRHDTQQRRACYVISMQLLFSRCSKST